MVKTLIRSLLFFVVLAVMAWLFYWLLPVTVQSRLSADHVRRVFGSRDIFPVAGESLSSGWTILLTAMKALGFGTGPETFTETFATAAALSGWISIGAIAVLALYVPVFALVLVALTPSVLWSSVVPNGTSLTFLLLALMGFLSHPGISYAQNRVKWTFGAFVDGIACSLTPLAWLLILLRVVRNRTKDVSLRWVIFAMGFSLHFVLGILLDASARTGPDYITSFSRLPVVSSLRSILYEDALGAGFVITGSGGEASLALLASIAIFAAILLSESWRGKFHHVKWVILILPFLVLVTAGSVRSWKLAHPGWNTVAQDFAENVERSFSRPTIAIVRSSTEEASLRYVSELVAKKQHVVTMRVPNLFESSTLARVKSFEPRFSVEEAMATESREPSFANFVQYLIVPNVKRGVEFWLSQLPDVSEGFQIKFLGNGYSIRGTTGVTKFDLDRDGLRGSSIRARVSAVEYVAGPSLEAEIFERYSIFHIATAKVIEREKKTIDWERRARGEYYAALKKVEWLPRAYEKVCVDPLAEEAAKTKAEPLDVCLETAWYHEPLRGEK